MPSNTLSNDSNAGEAIHLARDFGYVCETEFPAQQVFLMRIRFKKKVLIDPRTTFFTFPAIVPTSVWQLHLNNSTFKEWETITIAHISHNRPWSPFVSASVLFSI